MVHVRMLTHIVAKNISFFSREEICLSKHQVSTSDHNIVCFTFGLVSASEHLNIYMYAYWDSEKDFSPFFKW